jgi:hypothetical protein
VTEDLNFSDLAEVRRRVVEPVLAVLYRDGEVVEARVEVSGERLLVAITTVDETDTYDIGWAHSGMMDAVQVAYELADRIEEYISETSFAWGEQRRMSGPVPGPLT